MKKVILLTSLLIIFTSIAFAQFSMSGTLSFSNESAATKVYLIKINKLDQLFSGSNLGVVDSSAVDNKGNFKFTNAGVIEDNTFYRVNVTDTDKINPGGINMIGTHENFAFFFLNKHSQITFHTSVDQVSQKLVLTKTDKANILINKLNSIRKSECELVDELVKRRNALVTTAPFYADSLKEIRAQLRNSGFTTRSYEDIKMFADTVSDPYISLLAMNFLPDDTFHSFFLKMNDRYQQMIPRSEYAAQFNDALTGGSAYLAVGSKAPEIRLPDSRGKTVTLSDLKGRYILINFWASWCHPCRAENVSTVKPLYDKYHSRGFEVLSISTDINRTAWEEAIKKDQTEELHNVSDLKGMASGASEEYKISYLPYNYLVDAHGTIIARNLRGPDLEKMLTKLFE